MTKFVALYDAHWGWERKNGHKVPLHDIKAINSALDFIRDFKPDVVILGGDILDCGVISHHNKGKPGHTEGLRLLADCQEARSAIIEPLEASAAKGARFVYHKGNHEAWLDQLVEEVPALEGIIDVRALLKLGKKWEVIPQGEASTLGKLTFIHGDQLSGGEHVAKNAVTMYERNVRFGHYHTTQSFTKTSPFDYKQAKTGVAVPCLCTKFPAYGKGKPNRWAQGFLFGYVDEKSGMFNDYVVNVVNGRFMVNGKEYGK